MAEPSPSDAAAWRGRTVLVCGVRLAGVAAARALLARDAHVRLVDREHTLAVDELEAAGARYIGDPSALPHDVELVVTSPGLRPDHPLLLDAARAGVEVVGELEFAWRLRGPGAAPWLVVTGTNGKTTTVRMLESILRADGRAALAVGNVGVSVIDAVDAGLRYDVLAVEASSYQLHWSSSITPAAGVVLNLAPDHLDWHGSFAAYAAAKTRAWTGGIRIANVDDGYVAELFANVTGRRVGTTLDVPGGGELGIVDERLVDHAFGADVVLAEVADVRPPGRHNVANALAAAALARSVAVAPEAVGRGLRAFEPDPHRNELVTVEGGVRYVDDSKATNPHAAAASLLAYRPVVWIAGGQLKDAPVDELVRSVADRLLGVVLLGIDRAQIADALRRHAPQVPMIDVSTGDDEVMTEVVRAATSLARPGATVLLAPAAASYDMFSGYAARGEAFSAAVRALSVA